MRKAVSSYDINFIVLISVSFISTFISSIFLLYTDTLMQLKLVSLEVLTSFLSFFTFRMLFAVCIDCGQFRFQHKCLYVYLSELPGTHTASRFFLNIHQSVRQHKRYTEILDLCLDLLTSGDLLITIFQTEKCVRV